MIVSFNPNISNKKRQATNFGAVDTKIVNKYKANPLSVVNNDLAGLQFKRQQDLIDTVKHILSFETLPGRVKALKAYLA